MHPETVYSGSKLKPEEGLLKSPKGPTYVRFGHMDPEGLSGSLTGCTGVT